MTACTHPLPTQPTPAQLECATTVILPNDWQGQPLTVLGLSKSGMAVARYVASRGAQVFLSEMLPATPNNATQRREMAALNVAVETGGHTHQCYQHAPLVVASPGIPPSSPILRQLSLSKIPVISEVELAWQEAGRQATPPFWVGITGTNGKTTTTTLIGELFKAHADSPQQVGVCGNIGTPVLDAMMTQPELSHLVVELSSFQLAFSPCLTPAVGVFLNLSPDHINWHGSMEAYKQAKASLFAHMTPNQVAVLNGEDEACQGVAADTAAHVVWFTRQATLPDTATVGVVVNKGALCWVDKQNDTVEAILPINDLRLRGQHNVQNVAAAIAVAKASGIASAKIASVCKGFKGVAHRLQTLHTYRHPRHAFACQVVNDSKATNVLAAVAAVSAYGDTPTSVLLGGRPKDEPLTPLEEKLAAHPLTGMALYGEAIERFTPLATQVGVPLVSATGLDDACRVWANAITEGRIPCTGNTLTLLFSPACASFDQYRDFEIRGNAFAMAIDTALQAEGWEVTAE